MENDGFIIIPARNEAESIGYVISGIQKLNFISVNHIIVADNGSSDETSKIAKSLGVRVVHESRLGYGGACLAATEVIALESAPPKWVIICDGDGSDDPKDIPILLQKLTLEDADLVIGSRVLGVAEKDSLGRIQRLGNKLTCILIKIFYRQNFTDLGPLRIIRYTSLIRMNLKDRTWGWNIEMQIRALQEKMKIIEIPVDYRKRHFGSSKISGSIMMVMRVGSKILYTFFKLRFLNHGKKSSVF